ncbi:MAG: MBL fold metallo-hydrolase [Desulfuromonadaceae bacterium]|nr:MBL fold metallo-hydrolase [Desulfuromonadaceae bacterium]
MKQIALLALFFLFVPITVSAANFSFKKVRTGVYAAIAEPGGKAASNSLIVFTNYQVILAGSHFVPETIKELLDFIKTITPIPLRYIILTHHHRGFNHVDFDLPANVEIIASGQTWQALKSEFRQIKNQVTFFDRSLTMKRGSTLMVLNASERSHSEGDVFVYMPEEGVLFTSDLVYNDVAGYMGDANFLDWSTTLEMLTRIDIRTVVPGLGDLTTTDGIIRFQTFFKAFTTEILRLTNKGLEVEAAKREFSLPEYDSLPGFRAFFDAISDALTMN